MGMVDIFEDLCLDAEAKNDKKLWLRAAAAALIIASRKTSKRRAASWTREAVDCLLHANPAMEEVLEDLLYYSPWRAFEEVWNLYQGLYGDPYEIVPTS